LITLEGVASGAGDYTWTGPNAFTATTLNTMVSDSGWYYLTFTFSNQCVFTDSVYIGMNMDIPVANAGQDFVLDCHQMNVLLDGSATTGQHLDFAWANANGIPISSQPVIQVSEAGIYSLHVTNTSNGCRDSDEAVVSVDPDLLLGMDAYAYPENCIGYEDGSIEVSGISGGLPPFQFMLGDKMINSNGSFMNLSPGMYQLSVSDANDCVLDTNLVIGAGLNLELSLDTIIELIAGHTGQLQGQVNVPIPSLTSIQWNPPGLLGCDTCLTTTIMASNDQVFQLTVVHQNGCTDTAEIIVHVVPEKEIYIPNVFSPNDDGLNDFFTLYSNDRVQEIIEMNIFSRWGEHVFHRRHFPPNDDKSGWDGRFRNQTMMPGIYVYQILVALADGTAQRIAGDVTLLR
jgi:gliding motility-associated-like protein